MALDPRTREIQQELDRKFGNIPEPPLEIKAPKNTTGTIAPTQQEPVVPEISPLDLSIQELNQKFGVTENSGFKYKKFDKYIDGQIDPIQGDIEEVRAQAQSKGVKLLTGLGRVGSKVLTETAKIPGELYGLGDWASTGFDVAKFEETINNEWVKSIDNFAKETNDELLPVYKRKVVENGGLLRQVVSPEFWATEGADGIGFLISMMGPGLVTKSLKIPKMVSEGSKLLGLSAKSSLKVGKYADDIVAGGINTIIESTAEGIEAANSTKAALYDKKVKSLMATGQYNQQEASDLAAQYLETPEAKTIIGKAGANTTAANMAILLGPNILDQKWLFNGFNRAGKVSKDINKKLFQTVEGLGVEGAKQVGKYTSRQLAKEGLTKAGIGIGKEGFFEEGTQFATSEYFKNRALGQDDRGVVEGILGTYMESLSDTDMQKSIFLGSVLGGGMGSIGAVRGKKLEDKLLYGDSKKGTVGLSELFKNNFVNRYKTISDLTEKDENGNPIYNEDGSPKIDLAKAKTWGSNIVNDEINKQMLEYYNSLGLTNLFDFAKMVHDFNYMMPFFQQEGGKEMLLQHINNLAEKDATYLKETLGIEPQSVQQIRQELLNKADKFEDIYYRVAQAHKIPNVEIEKRDVKTFDEFNKSILDTKLSNELSQIFVADKIEETDREIQTLSSKANRTSLEEPKLQKLIKAKEAFIENLEDLKKEAKELNNSNSIKESWTEYKNNLNKTKKDIIDEAVESAETSQDIEDITSTVETEEFEANNPPEVAEAIFGKINNKAKEETINKGKENLDAINNLAEKISKGVIEFSPEELQLQANYPKELEEALINLKNASKLTSPITKNRWDNSVHKFTAEKVGFMGKLISLEDKTPEETSIIRKLGSSRKDSMYANLIEAQKYPRVAQEVNNFFNQQDKLQTKSTEEKEFDKQINKLQSNPVDSEVEGTIEPSVNFTTDIPTEKSNVFHINASQYAVKVVDKRRQVVGDKLPFANQFNWEAINNLPIGSELTAKIDPDHIVYIEGKPLKNSEVAPNQQLVSLFSEDGAEVGILYTQTEANKALFPIWRSEVQNKGEKKFKVVQKYKGDINTYTEIKDGDITIPAARNSLTDIERAYGKKLILGYVHGTTAGSIVRTPNKDIPEIRLGTKNKSGQIVVALPKGNGEYMAYGLITKSLKQGEGVDYKNVPLAENNAFKEVLDSLKGLQVGNIEGNEILIDKLHSFISLPTLISTNKKTGTPYIQFNPVHIKKKHLDAFKDVKGINSYLREGKKEGDAGAYVVLVSKDIIDNLQLTEYDKGTPEAVLMDFLGEMKLQIDGDKLNQDDYYETISKRTKTNLANDPVVNVSFFIQPTTDEVQLTPKEVDTTVQKSKTKDISDVKKEEELPAKELGNIKDNVAEVSNLDQTDGNPININNRSKNGVDFLFESNPELANAVYEALGFNQNKKIIASIKKNNKIITQYSDDTFDVVVDKFAYEEAKAKYYKDYIERKKYIKKVEKNPSIIEDYWDEKSESRVIFPLLHMSKYEFNKKLNSIVTFSIDGDEEYGFGAKKFNPKEFDLVATRNDERVGYKKTPLKEFIGFLEEANEKEYKDNLGILELWKSPEGIKRMKDEIQFYYDRSEFEKSSAERLPKEFKASNKGYTLREAGGGALNIIKGSGGAIRGYLLYKGRTSNGQPDAYNLIDSITDTDVYIRYTQVNEEFRGEKLSSILLDRVRKDYPNHYVHRTLIVNSIVVVQSSKIVGAADAFGNSIENINTISKATEWLKTNNEIILPPLSKGKINRQQKQEAQQKFQEYVNATGRQDIEGFKNFVSTNKQPVKIETPTKRGRTTLVRKPESKLRTGAGTYKVWNKEKELNWLSKQLPNIPVEVLSDISDLQQGLDADVYGRFENSLDVLGNPVGTIKLAENTKVGTAYHEAFHTVFWVGLNSRQRRSVLKDAKNQYGEFSDDTLEEMMADNFISYVETEGNIEIKGSFIKNFFEKIYNWIKYNVFGQVEIKNLYYKINSGQYANLKPVKVNVSKLSSSLRPAIFEDRVNTLVANFSLAIDDYVDEHPELVNLTRTQLLKSIDTGETSSSIEYFLIQAYNSLYEDYESDPDSTWGKQMAVFLNETVKSITPEGKVLWGPIGKKALQKIASREGFKVHANQILEVQNANPDEEYEISEEEARSEGWQVDVKSQSGQMGLSNEVRKELSYIPLTGDKAVDDLGYQRYIDFDSVHATLMRELADLNRRDRVEKKLKELVTTTRPELLGIYNKFISEDPANEIFKTHLVNDFAKTHVDFKMAVQKNDGRVVIYSSNSTTIVNMIIDSWQSEFYNSGYFTPDGNVNVDKITPIINEILKAPTVVEKMKLFNDRFNLDLDSRVFDNISQDMLYIIGDLSKGSNIFETNTSKLKELAKLDAKYKTDLLESSFRNIEGKTVYSHILPSFTSKQIANMKYDFDTWYNYYSTDTFYKNSPLLNSILKDRSILDNLEYSMIDGSKYRGESEGTSYADFSDKQFLSMQINMFYNNGTKNYGWYQTPILSDSPEGVYIKLPKYKTSDALDKLVEVAKQEYERIKESHDNKLGVKNFDENANKFLFMTFLRRPDLEKSDEEIKQIIKDGLSKKFNDYWEFLQKNNIFDLSDNLGVTRELIPNYFKLKEEKRTTLIEEELNEVKASMWNYFLNQVYAGSQIITLTTGDPAFYKSVTDYYKRAKEIVSPTMQMDSSAVYVLSEDEIKNEGASEQVITPGENYSALYVNDVNIVGQIGKELFDTFTKTGDIFYAQTAAKYGYSNDKDGKFLEVEIEGKKYKFKSDLVNVADAQTFISPNRYRKVAVGYGRWNKQIQQTFGRMVSNKPLLPEDYQVAMQPYKPFVFGHIKQGNKVIPVQNKNSEAILFPQLAKASPTLQKLYNIMTDPENNLDSISFESVVKVGLSNAVSWEDLLNGIDIKDKIHTLDNSNYGLQQEVPVHYIDDSALFGTQIMKHIIANLDLTADYNGRTGQELADYFQKLISENVEISYKQAREELGLSGDIVDNKKLSEILQREILSRDLGEDIFEAAGLDINGEFNIHPADPLHSDRNEKLLNSIYKNRVTRQKIKGGSFVQASGIGFMDDLQMVTKKNPDGTIKSIDYVECMLPWSSRKHFEPFMDENGLIDINKVPSDLLDMIGYRIPTEDKYSMLPLRVVGFLPAQMGGVVMLPMEITTLAGSDFDVDKLYVMMPEFEISSDKQDIRKITDTTTTEGRNNMLIDLMRDVLTNEKTFKQFIKPGGFSDLQKNANIIYLVAEKVGKYSDIVNWSDKQINDAVESLIAKQGIDLTSPLSNARMFNRNMTGKKLVGIEANHNANHSILQFTNIALSKPIIIDGKTYQSLHDIYNNAGELISNNVAQRLAAVVDNAKDPNAFKANLNTYTADVDALLTRLGVPMIQSFALLKQPIVVELTRLYYLHGGDFNAEETAINEIYQKHPYPEQSAKDKGKYSPNLKRNSIDISFNDLIEGLNDDWTSDNQLFILAEFLLYKDKAKSLAKLINSMSSMTNGSGPTSSDNEIIIRAQREILLDENLVGVAELFSGEKYPLFKAFNDYGLIKPQEDLKKVFPLGNTNEDSWVNKTKLLLQNSIAKNKLSAKDLNKFNNFILSYISDGFDLYDPKLQKYFVENFPAKYKKTLEVNQELKEFRITKFIKFQQDDNFPFGRLEFNNTGALTNTLKDDLKDSWYQMLTDDNPETRKFALNLLRYSKYKEGFLFGPKTYTHIQPTKFFTSVEEGRAINKAWKKVFKAEDLDMIDKDSERVVKQFIRNNWKNTGFVPIVEETSKITFVEGKPSAVSVNIKDSKYKTDAGFVEFVKVPIQIVVGKKTKTDYVLMEKAYQTYNDNGTPIAAVYRPTNKLGKSAYLVETNRMMDNFSSILPENNIGKVADVDIRSLANSAAVEEETLGVDGEEISSYSDNLAFALTNPNFTSPTGYDWKRQWTKGQKLWRDYMSNGIEFEGKKYKDVEEAYQQNKKKYSTTPTLFSSETTDDLMIKLLKIKLQTYPKLIEGIEVKGGIEYLQNSTHQPTQKNSHWETGGDNAFIKDLIEAYKQVSETFESEENIVSLQEETKTFKDIIETYETEEKIYSELDITKDTLSNMSEEELGKILKDKIC